MTCVDDENDDMNGLDYDVEWPIEEEISEIRIGVSDTVELEGN